MSAPLCACGCGEPAPVARTTNRQRGFAKGDYLPYVHAHQARKSAVRYLEEDRGYDTPCWTWQGNTRRGYGRMTIGGRGHQAHRVYYERLVGPIPAGLTIDHLCRNRACVNPAHMEPVTLAENSRRGRAATPLKTHCANGHEFAGDNVTRAKNGQRVCRQCKRESNRRINGLAAVGGPTPPKLTADQVRLIRQATGTSQKVIAQQFGISQTHVSRIRRGVVWKDAGPDDLALRMVQIVDDIIARDRMPDGKLRWR